MLASSWSLVDDRQQLIRCARITWLDAGQDSRYLVHSGFHNLRRRQIRQYKLPNQRTAAMTTGHRTPLRDVPWMRSTCFGWTHILQQETPRNAVGAGHRSRFWRGDSKHRRPTPERRVWGTRAMHWGTLRATDFARRCPRCRETQSHLENFSQPTIDAAETAMVRKRNTNGFRFSRTAGYRQAPATHRWRRPTC